MKFLYLLILVLFVMACSADESPSAMQELPQRWKLVKITNSMTGESVGENNLPYTITIQLNKDSTFVKSRKEDDTVLSATGAFTIVQNENSTELILDHDSENGLIENCGAGTTEHFQLLPTGQLFGGAVPCDGPGYHFSLSKLSF